MDDIKELGDGLVAIANKLGTSMTNISANNEVVMVTSITTILLLFLYYYCKIAFYSQMRTSGMQ